MSQQSDDGDRPPVDGSNWSRRDVIRRGGLTLGVGFAAVAATPNSVLAHYCPRTHRYWADNPAEWPTFPDDGRFVVLDGSGNEQLLHPDDNRSRLLGELRTPAGEDAYLALVKRYVAARLNRRFIAPLPTGYDDFWEQIGAYNRWVRNAERPQREWVVSDVDGRALKRYFDAWNAGFGWECEVERSAPSEFNRRRR